MKQEMSPMETFKWALKIWAVLLVVTFGGCATGFHFDEPYSSKVSTEATLVQAYSSMQKCGKHNSCEEFTGLFRTADGKTYTRPMTGFHYHNYLDGGKKEQPGCYITLSANQRGIETPFWIKALMSLGLLGGFLALAGFILLIVGMIDVEYAQKDWEREQERKAREHKYGRNW